jgi:methyltransferase-like protein
MSQNPNQDDDAVHHWNLPFPRSHPERLAVLARFHGMSPHDPAKARVLELNCGAGQNLLAMAERCPGGRFIGIDALKSRVAGAARAAQEIGVSNVEFQQRSLKDVGDEFGEFDYIIAHDYYSHLLPDDRGRLMMVCRQRLAPQGLAYVSYNTYPGCHLQEIFRKMMLFDARGAATPAEQAARSRMLLEFLSTSLTDHNNPYDALVQAEIEPLRRQDDWHLQRERLAERHEPVYFRHFMAGAVEQGLQLVGDCSLGFRANDFLEPDIERYLAQIAPDPIVQEQYRDIVRNRAFRQSVLCRDDVTLQYAPTLEMVLKLWVEAPITCDNSETSLTSMVADRFTNRNGLMITTSSPLVKAALTHLGAIWPNYIVFEELLAAARQRMKAVSPHVASPNEMARLADSLLECGLKGVVELHGQPQDFTTEIAPRPVASPLARWQCPRGEVITNRVHEAVRVEALDRVLLPLLDGTRDVVELAERLSDTVAQGRLVVEENQQRVQDPQRILLAMNAALPQSLMRLARSAFLIA